MQNQIKSLNPLKKTSRDFQILSPQLAQEIAKSPKANRYLVLEEGEYKGLWGVYSLSRAPLLDFHDLIGRCAQIAPNRLDSFLNRASELDYEVVFADDPLEILKPYQNLDDIPEIKIHSSFPNTKKGLLPFQIKAYNYLKNQDSGIILFSTGLGKTLVSMALLLINQKLNNFDYCFFVTKNHACVNTQRMLSELGHIEAIILTGNQKQRHELYKNFKPGIYITNYEKFRIDKEFLLPYFSKRILIFWDEAPTKLKNRQTKLYKSVNSLLYSKGNIRPKWLKQYVMTATPIENSPLDYYSVVKLLDPSIFGNIQQFYNDYVATFLPFSNSIPSSYKNLEKMGLKTAHLTYRVDKQDPDIAKQFPEVVETPLFIDWHPKDKQIYDVLIKEAKTELSQRQIFGPDAILSLITIMQMMCDMPSMINRTGDYFIDTEDLSYSHSMGSKYAANFLLSLGHYLSDANHSKLQTLIELIKEDHKDEKILVFSAFNLALLPYISELFDKNDISHVLYSGTQKEKQIAQDRFQQDKDIQVFLSSDAGSDSINLEQASVCIHYDLPWKMSTYIQRQNRAHRITSNFKAVRFYRLIMVNSIEERKWRILEKKQKFANEIFSDNFSSIMRGIGKDELSYILFG